MASAKALSEARSAIRLSDTACRPNVSFRDGSRPKKSFRDPVLVRAERRLQSRSPSGKEEDDRNAAQFLAIRADERRLTNQPLNWSNAQKKTLPERNDRPGSPKLPKEISVQHLRR